MPKQPNYIALQVQNNVNQIVRATLMGGPINNEAQSNATKFYSYDLSSETFAGINSVRLDYTIISSSLNTFQIKPLVEKTIAGVTAALNSMNVGQWYYAGTTIYYYNNNYIPDKIFTS